MTNQLLSLNQQIKLYLTTSAIDEGMNALLTRMNPYVPNGKGDWRTKPRKPIIVTIIAIYGSLLIFGSKEKLYNDQTQDHKKALCPTPNFDFNNCSQEELDWLNGLKIPLEYQDYWLDSCPIGWLENDFQVWESIDDTKVIDWDKEKADNILDKFYISGKKVELVN